MFSEAAPSFRESSCPQGRPPPAFISSVFTGDAGNQGGFCCQLNTNRKLLRRLQVASRVSVNGWRCKQRGGCGEQHSRGRNAKSVNVSTCRRRQSPAERRINVCVHKYLQHRPVLTVNDGGFSSSTGLIYWEDNGTWLSVENRWIC